MNSRTIFVAWLIALMLSVSLAMASDLSPEPISVVDSVGYALGKLPTLLRGSEALVPLRTLAQLANWKEQVSDTECSITVPNGKVSFRSTSSFAEVGNKFVQLRAAPELWDGSLWCPIRSVEELFCGTVRLSADGRTLRITSVVSLAASVVDSIVYRVPEAKSHWTLGTIILDPGHGGKDPGAPGPPGWHEKLITLDIARRLDTLISRTGLTAKLTRNDDEFVSLQQRTRYANELHGDLFLSIHCNSNRDRSVHGVEAYFLKPARTNRAVDVAMRENSVVKLEDSSTVYRDLTQENYILLHMATSQNLKDSESWASQTTVKMATPGKLTSRGVDQAGFYVLMGAQMPAVLVECGYLSNSSDVKILTSEKGRQSIAEALLNSILEMKAKLETSSSR